MQLKKYSDEVYPLIKELCKIPAPSFFEDERAEFCKNYFKSAGFDSVYIDEAKNVVCEYNVKNSNELTVFVAHTDTVFPDKEPMPFYEENGRAYSPGIGDDTASLAVLLVASKYFKENNIVPSKGILFVANSCEEGLGDLKGTRNLMKNYEGRIKNFISFDSKIKYLTVDCVGSHRYKVLVETKGGHSFGNFGNENAISNLSKIINKIYEIEVPVIDNSRTTYNVGIVSGGTSVNTIAQSAEMLCEYRSNNVNCLREMQSRFEKIFNDAQSDDVKVTVTKVGDRPCTDGVDKKSHENLVNICKEIIEEVAKIEVICNVGSTDCNIPMSLGIPGVAIGVYNGGGVHTREEWIEIDSLILGFEIAIKLIGKFM